MKKEYIDKIIEKLKENSSSRTVGLFDSGISGTSVVKELDNIAPNINIVYLGDNKNFPYGEKSEEELIILIKKNIEYLLSQNISHLGIACNTAASVLEKNLPLLFDSPLVFDPISSVREYIKGKEDINKILVIGSRYTVSSGIYSKTLNGLGSLIVVEASKQLLIENIEKGNEEKIRREIEKIFSFVKVNGIDTLVLGCTHYGYIKDRFTEVLGKDVLVIDPSEVMAKDIFKAIGNNGDGNRDIVFTKDRV